MDVTKLSLDEFLNEDDCERDKSAAPDFNSMASLFEPFVGSKVRDLDDEYAVHELGNEGPSNVALKWKDAFVGFYDRTLIVIAESHQGKKLSVPLILEASKHRPPPPPRNLTNDGRHALTLAWEVANGVKPDPWA